MGRAARQTSCYGTYEWNVPGSSRQARRRAPAGECLRSAHHRDFPPAIKSSSCWSASIVSKACLRKLKEHVPASHDRGVCRKTCQDVSEGLILPRKRQDNMHTTASKTLALSWPLQQLQCMAWPSLAALEWHMPNSLLFPQAGQIISKLSVVALGFIVFWIGSYRASPPEYRTEIVWQHPGDWPG
jgi:hypothetical protein